MPVHTDGPIPVSTLIAELTPDASSAILDTSPPQGALTSQPPDYVLAMMDETGEGFTEEAWAALDTPFWARFDAPQLADPGHHGTQPPFHAVTAPVDLAALGLADEARLALTDAPAADAGLQRPGDITRLGDRIAELSSRIQAATHEMLVLLGEFDARRGWSGHASCAHWLHWRTGLSLGAAREHVRVARSLAGLPRLSDAMRQGQVSYSKVRAVTRVATPENEEKLLDVAQTGTASQVERIVRGWRRVDRQAERSEEQERQDRRGLRTWVDEDGMVQVRGCLTPEAGAALRRALEAACDQTRRVAAPGAQVGADDGSPGARADGLPPELAGDVAAVEEQLASTFAQRQADALGMLAECALAGGLDKGTAGDRYQVVLHVDAGALADARNVPAGTYDSADLDADTLTDSRNISARISDGTKLEADTLTDSRNVPAGTPTAESAEPDGGGQTVLDEAGGIHVSAETARRLACDSSVVKMQHGPGGEILDIGRKTRTISPALRRALAARDGRCRFPGCENRRCDAHHVQHWADGGVTKLDNLVLLCRRHHRLVHEEGFGITLDVAGEVRFTRPDGRPFPVVPPPPLWSGEPLAPVNKRLEQEGIEIDGETALPAWKGERFDVGWAVSALWEP